MWSAERSDAAVDLPHKGVRAVLLALLAGPAGPLCINAAVGAAILRITCQGCGWETFGVVSSYGCTCTSPHPCALHSVCSCGHPAGSTTQCFCGTTGRVYSSPPLPGC